MKTSFYCLFLSWHAFYFLRSTYLLKSISKDTFLQVLEFWLLHLGPHFILSVNFSVMVWGNGYNSFFNGYPIFLISFFKDCSSPLNYFNQNKMTVYVLQTFLNSILFCWPMSVLGLTQYCLDHCSFLAQCEMRWCKLSNCFSFPVSFEYIGSVAFPYKF